MMIQALVQRGVYRCDMARQAVAYTFPQQQRRYPRPDQPLTFPAVRAIIQEIFTALFFASNPAYLKWIDQARRFLPLRI
jgi:hypothetical protein